LKPNSTATNTVHQILYYYQRSSAYNPLVYESVRNKYIAHIHLSGESSSNGSIFRGTDIKSFEILNDASLGTIKPYAFSFCYDLESFSFGSNNATEP
jgi:hypothetical protein